MNCHSRKNLKIMESLAEKSADYKRIQESEEKLTWCGGCGNYGIQKALIRALTLQNIKPWEVMVCYDVGCNGNGSDKMGTNSIHGLHGRVTALAAGAHLANHTMPVIAIGGDGASWSEGVGHVFHAVRNDYNITFLMHNNENYALTTGQASATTRKGTVRNATPDGVAVDPLNTIETVLTLNPTFVARTFSGDVNHMTRMIQEGVQHQGFAYIEIMQTCPTYNKDTSNKWFWDKIKYVEDIKDYDQESLSDARKAAADLDKQIMLGVLYRKKGIPHFLQRLEQRKNVKTPLTQEVKQVDITELMKRFT